MEAALEPGSVGLYQSHSGVGWAHLEVADDAVLLGPIQPTGGGGTQAGGSPHQQVSSGWVAAATGAPMAQVRFLPVPCHHSPHCREHEGTGCGLCWGAWTTLAPPCTHPTPSRLIPSHPVPSLHPDPLMQHEAP